MRLIPPVAVVLAMATAASSQAQGIIRGRVLDPDGQPMPNVQVTALEMTPDGGPGNARTVISGERGTFEVAAPAARIMLIARPALKLTNGRPAPPQHYPPAYFPGVLDRLDAWPIDVKAGEIVELDFHMPPVLVGSIKAVVSGPAGYSLDVLRVIRPEANQIRNVTLDAGVGYADSLREGRYVVVARGRSGDAPLAAWATVHMTSGEIAVTLELKPTATVYGRIVTEREGLPPIAGARVVAAWTDGTIDLDPLGRDDAGVAADGSFAIDGVFGTRLFRVAGLDAGWKVVTVRQGRADIMSSGIDLAPGTATEISIVVARK